MQKIFEALIDSYIDNNVGIAENFLNKNLAIQLKKNLTLLYNGNAMKNAGTGNEENILQDKLVRSDKIYWLDRDHNDLFENQFLTLSKVLLSILMLPVTQVLPGMSFTMRYMNQEAFTHGILIVSAITEADSFQ